MVFLQYLVWFFLRWFGIGCGSFQRVLPHTANTAKVVGSDDRQLSSQDSHQNNRINFFFAISCCRFFCYTLLKWGYYLLHVRILNAKFEVVRLQSPNKLHVLLHHVRAPNCSWLSLDKLCQDWQLSRRTAKFSSRSALRYHKEHPGRFFEVFEQ